MNLTSGSTAGARVGGRALAGWPEVGRWAAIAAGVAAVLLGCVGLIAAHLRGDFWLGVQDGVFAPHHDFGDVMYVFRRNLLVLGIHLCACWIGAIIGRRRNPVPVRWGWMGGTEPPGAGVDRPRCALLRAARDPVIETYVTPGWIATAAHHPVMPGMGWR